jgi:hypothetical protein
MGLRLSDQRHTNTIADAVSWLGYDPSINQTAESYFKTKVNKNSKSSQRQNWTAVSNTMVQTKVDTKDMKIVILCLQTTERRMEYTLRGQKKPSKKR